MLFYGRFAALTSVKIIAPRSFIPASNGYFHSQPSFFLLSWRMYGMVNERKIYCDTFSVV
jgi:hypothetical protein